MNDSTKTKELSLVVRNLRIRLFVFIGVMLALIVGILAFIHNATSGGTKDAELVAWVVVQIVVLIIGIVLCSMTQDKLYDARLDLAISEWQDQHPQDR